MERLHVPARRTARVTDRWFVAVVFVAMTLLGIPQDVEGAPVDIPAQTSLGRRCAWTCGISPEGFAPTAERDSIEINGRSMTYIADIAIDTTASNPLLGAEDWWFGSGWTSLLAQTWDGVGDVSTLDLAENRPVFYVEHHRNLSRRDGRLGLRVEYHQPWRFSAQEVLDGAKGWIPAAGRFESTPIRQVVLVPDSLAYERDTLSAPLGSGHGIRVGLMWEGVERGGVRPRVDVLGSVVRPRPWVLRAPDDPSTWPAVRPEDTLVESPAWKGRMLVRAGGVVDLGAGGGGFRAASQFRLQVSWVPGGSLGLHAGISVSPTRR